MSTLVLVGAVVATAMAAAAFARFMPRWWARFDAKTFNATPSQDDYHDKFHRQRLTWRVLTAAGVAAVLALPWAWFSWWAYAAAALAYLVGTMGYFAYAFNNLLSVARGLPYVQSGYVSFDPRAANPDRWIVRRVQEVLPSVNPMFYTGSGAVMVQARVAALVLYILQGSMLAVSLTAAGFLLVIATILAVLC